MYLTLALEGFLSGDPAFGGSVVPSIRLARRLSTDRSRVALCSHLCHSLRAPTSSGAAAAAALAAANASALRPIAERIFALRYNALAFCGWQLSTRVTAYRGQ